MPLGREDLSSRSCPTPGARNVSFSKQRRRGAELNLSKPFGDLADLGRFGQRADAQAAARSIPVTGVKALPLRPRRAAAQLEFAAAAAWAGAVPPRPRGRPCSITF